ncbi:hypothetical protein ACFL5F_00425 [Planctomycetota bacterium]
MVELETVLVLGAGASWDFDFPTCGELVTQILENLGNSEIRQYSLFHEACYGKDLSSMAEKFHDVLQKAKPLSIDAWLEHNPLFIEVGKVAIAIALLGCEQRRGLRRGAKENWYQLLFGRLDSPFENFQNNKLSIITFNYDRSFEHSLFESFRYTHTEKSEDECKEKLNQLQIIHVYGSLGRLEWQSDNPKIPLTEVPYGAKLDNVSIIAAADNIKIMSEESKELPEEFQEARRLIANAEALYFLGFGYHETNMDRLGIDASVKPSKVMGTAYGLDYQRIREIERKRIHDLQRNYGLVDKSVYEFIHDYIDFNEQSLPGKVLK